jgi:hypothetical protein
LLHSWQKWRHPFWLRLPALVAPVVQRAQARLPVQVALSVLVLLAVLVQPAPQAQSVKVLALTVLEREPG